MARGEERIKESSREPASSSETCPTLTYHISAFTFHLLYPPRVERATRHCNLNVTLLLGGSEEVLRAQCPPLGW